MRQYLLILLGIFLCLGGCSEGPLKPEIMQPDLASTPAEGGADNRFASKQTAIQISENRQLKLEKSALGKPFLLHVEMANLYGADSSGTPTGGEWVSRKAYFKKEGEKIYLMRDVRSVLASEEFPANAIMTSFPILKEDEKSIQFDFNQGTASSLFVSDFFSEGKFITLYDTQVLESMIEDAFQTLHGVAVVQTLQLVENQSLGEGEESIPTLNHYRATYYLEPDEIAPNFTPKRPPDMNKMGFFETPSFVKGSDGTIGSYIAKFDISKPIRFYLADNIPEEWRQTVAEGVLYWNKAFGKDVIEVRDAPQGVRAPHPDYNMVQWFTNRSAGTAYADYQLNPETGAVRHAQIFVSNNWVLSPFDNVAKDQGVNARGLCQRDIPKLPLNMLIPADGQKISESGRDAVIHANLRSVVAHEIGHILGLRHNFAASQGSELLLREISRRFQDLLRDGKTTHDQIPAASVMDYIEFESDVLMGDYIGNPETPALPYDKMAIEWSYYDREPTFDLNRTIFCTDGLADSNFVDCLRYDRSGHPIAIAAYAFDQGLQSVAQRVAGHYFYYKTYYDESERAPVGNIAIDAGNTAERIASEVATFLSLLRKETESIYVFRHFGELTDSNAMEYQTVQIGWIANAVKEGGGFQKMLARLRPENVIQKMKQNGEQFRQIVRSEAFRVGVLASGETYTFSDREIDIMIRNTKPYFKLLEDKIFPAITNALVGSVENRYLPIVDSKNLESILAAWSRYIIMTGAESIPRFDREHRLDAVQILESDQAMIPGWQQKNRQSIRAELLEKLKERYGADFETVSPENFSEADRVQYETEVVLLAALEGK